MNPTREQMELAAKAAGIEIVFMNHGSVMGTLAYHKLKFSTGPAWNPLKYGDDSQRLQVKLRIDVDWFDKRTSVQAWMEGFIASCIPNPAIPDDDLRAMREAIFLVAVEIGRAMK